LLSDDTKGAGMACLRENEDFERCRMNRRGMDSKGWALAQTSAL
jgi:hypothetical protein